MKNYYDIAIIGGGIGGLMTAYRITEKNPSASVCIIEKGHAIEQRTCPIVTKKVDKCIKCPSCAIMEGLAGAGAFSDGKYVILHRIRRMADRISQASNSHRLH